MGNNHLRVGAGQARGDRLSDPARRLREGIALFNESEHAGTVASISKAFGLPMVHAALDDTAPGQGRGSSSGSTAGGPCQRRAKLAP